MSSLASQPIVAGGVEPLLEVSDGAAAVRRVPLGRHLVIGRAPDAGLRLEGGTISRHHAEIYRDPFGRWWVRDLGSRNGVRFNGQKVPERALHAGSLFQIGPYTLKMCMPPSVSGLERLDATTDTLSTPAKVHIEDRAVGHLSTLEESEQPRIAGTHLSALMIFGRELLDIELPADRLNALCRLMVSEQFFGTSALVFQMGREVANGEDGTETFAAQINSGPVFAAVTSSRFEAQTPYLSRSLMRHLREHGRPVLASNISTMPDAIEMSISPGVAMLAAVACPILAEPTDLRLKVLYVTLPPHCGTTDWLAVVSFAVEQYRLAESAWVSRRYAQEQATTELELQRARQIQLRLIPRRLAVPGFDIAVGYEPCRWVGGDYVDVAPTSTGQVLLAVADVCGKGMPAALIATSLRTMVRTGLQAGMDLPDLFSATRGQLDDCLATDTFITMAAVMADPDGGALRCVNAGHPAPLIISPDGSVRELPCADNFPLGIMVEPIECRDENLARGELLVMFTDGISELSDPSGEMLGTRRFGEIAAKIYAQGSMLPVVELASQITDALSRHRGPRSADDDQTFLLAKRL